MIFFRARFVEVLQDCSSQALLLTQTPTDLNGQLAATLTTEAVTTRRDAT